MQHSGCPLNGLFSMWVRHLLRGLGALPSLLGADLCTFRNHLAMDWFHPRLFDSLRTIGGTPRKGILLTFRVDAKAWSDSKRHSKLSSFLFHFVQSRHVSFDDLG
jgi:hypothetical protein